MKTDSTCLLTALRMISLCALAMMGLLIANCGDSSVAPSPVKTLIDTKWRLTEVQIVRDYHQQVEIFDYSEKNIIYEFQRNNKLVVTGNAGDEVFVFDDFEEGEHFYEVNWDDPCKGDPLCDPGPNLRIDGKGYGAFLGGDTLVIGTFSMEIDETGSYYSWNKTLIGLK